MISRHGAKELGSVLRRASSQSAVAHLASEPGPSKIQASSEAKASSLHTWDDALGSGLGQPVNSARRPRLRFDRESQYFSPNTSNTFFFPNASPGLSRRSYSTRPSHSQSTSPSLPASPSSSWEHVFSDLDDLPKYVPPLSSSRSRPMPSTAEKTKIRRQTMTAREISAFDDMFTMIFDAVSDGASKAKKTGSGSLLPSLGTHRDDPLSDVGIGNSPSEDGMSSLFGKLRRHSKHFAWTSETDELLDRKKEAMELCTTDQELLEWAMQNVFEDSKKHEEEALRAIALASVDGSPTDDTESSPSKGPPTLQCPTYPYMVSGLIKMFRERYHDPHLALSIFDHARHLSIPSYVFGCSTDTYNELIETRWKCFRDLRGVCDALEEMRVNGVDMDTHTSRLLEQVRRETGDRNLWEEDTVGSGEVWSMLEKIEKLAAADARDKNRAAIRAMGAKRNPSPWKNREEWKSAGDDLDGSSTRKAGTSPWEFNAWDAPPPRPWLKPKDDNLGK